MAPDSTSSAQHIGCSVNSCAFNEGGQRCRLRSIQVSAVPGMNSGGPDESMCASYKTHS